MNGPLKAGKASYIQPGQDRKWAAFSSRSKGDTLNADGRVLFCKDNPEATLVFSANIPAAALPITSQLKEGLRGALRWWMLYRQTGAKGT